MPSSLSHHCCPLPRAAIYYHHLPPTIHHSLSVLCHPPLITYLPFTLTTFPSSSAAPCPAFMNSYHPLFIAYHPLLPPTLYLSYMFICHSSSATLRPSPTSYHHLSLTIHRHHRCYLPSPSTTYNPIRPPPRPSITTLHHHSPPSTHHVPPTSRNLPSSSTTHHVPSTILKSLSCP